MRGQNQEALLLLKEEPPPAFATTDIAVLRKTAQGRAEVFSQRPDDAEKDLREAEDLANKFQPQLVGEVALAECSLDFSRENFQAMERDSRKALAIARQQSESFLEARALERLGLALMRQEHYDEAIERYRASLQLAQSLQAHALSANTEGNLGWSYFEMGDLESALTLFEQAQEGSAQTGYSGSQVYWLINIGNVYSSRGDYEPAKNEFQQALAIARNLGDRVAVFQCVGNLAIVALEEGQLDAAEQYNNEAQSLARANADETGAAYCFLTAARIEGGRGHFPQAEQLFRRVIQEPKAEAPLRWEAQALLAQTFEAAGRPEAAEREFRKSLETIEKARTSLHHEEYRLSFLSSAIQFYDDYIGFLVSRGRMMDALEVAELSRARTLAAGLGASPDGLRFPIPGFHPQEAAQRLGATLLFYWLGNHRSYLWAITPARVALFPLPAAGEIDSAVNEYREDLAGPRDVLETPHTQGTKLYETLIGPAKKLIPKGSRVIVLPDGSLYGLNFETLPVSLPEPHYWIDDAVIANASSLTLLAKSAGRPAARLGALFLIGNPVPAGDEFPALPNAQAEMDSVEFYFPETRRHVLFGSQATPLAYLDGEPGKFSFIHFVAHGTASRARPLESAVILTKAGDSYKLYARDIVSRPLDAYLVTISACNTAGTRTFSGEGLIGLAWAFLRAGAHNVIASLWEVSDASTPQLMDRLYSEIHRGRDPATALRAAKLSLLHSSSIYRKPFYWAPFQLYAGG